MMDFTTFRDFSRCVKDVAPAIINRPSCSPGMYQTKEAHISGGKLSNQQTSLLGVSMVVARESEVQLILIYNGNEIDNDDGWVSFAPTKERVRK